MTRSTLFDRLNQELEAFGKKAQAALDEGKLQIELLRLRRRLDRAARDLGLLVHRRERGGETDSRRFDALLLRLDDFQADIARLEKQIAEARRGSASKSSTTPAPVGVGADTNDTPGAE
jgi:50S ribosomal subunit-associated GTPase HflX